MSKDLNECKIYNDTYCSYLIPSECENCLLKRDCIKIKLSSLNNYNLGYIDISEYSKECY